MEKMNCNGKCISPTECRVDRDGGACLGNIEPVSAQPLIYRLRKRAEIRRNIPTRTSVVEDKPDRVADLLEEAATEIENLRTKMLDQRIQNVDTLMNIFKKTMP